MVSACGVLQKAFTNQTNIIHIHHRALFMCYQMYLYTVVAGKRFIFSVSPDV